LHAQTSSRKHRSGKFACLPAVAAVERQPARPHIAGMSSKPSDAPAPTPAQPDANPPQQPPRPKEIGGPKGPEPTRYGDWEYNGRCTDF